MVKCLNTISLKLILSLTGANADYRTPIKPSEQEDLLYKVYQAEQKEEK